MSLFKVYLDKFLDINPNAQKYLNIQEALDEDQTKNRSASPCILNFFQR